MRLPSLPARPVPPRGELHLTRPAEPGEYAAKPATRYVIASQAQTAALCKTAASYLTRLTVAADGGLLRGTF